MNEFSSELLNTAPCGFLSVASDGTILLVNTTLAHWLESSPQQLQGQAISAVLSMAGRVFYETNFWPQLKLHGRIEEVYFSLRSSQGRAVPVLANSVRRARASDVVYDCVFLRIRQRDQYENELILAKKAAEQANQAKAKFLSMMSHELRTPLNAIAGFAQIMAAEIDGTLTSAQKEDLGHIQVASDSLLHLINDILNFAHMERDEVEVSMEGVDVEEAIAQAESLLRPRWQAAGLHFKRPEAALGGATVFADPNRLQQILLNLLTNAIKFTPRGGTLGVNYAACEDHVLLRVHDSGVGIAPDQLPCIFEPFVQVNRLQVESGQRGVGLGLAICRKLARAMNGDLTATSTLGQGSVLSLSLLKAPSKEIESENV